MSKIRDETNFIVKINLIVLDITSNIHKTIVIVAKTANNLKKYTARPTPTKKHKNCRKSN